MQLKDIRQFRSTWRKEQGYDMPNWDENFIGASFGDKSGFYKMINGIVENIQADLTPKLQNAQDEQALYEFLQNAADAAASECAIIYDEQYFLVINNGKPFTDKDLKALLNSFQGTKADKSKPENCGKIGRYGIGFKLAYRLLGKSDGAEELLRDLAGPLIYSWHNAGQWENLLQGKIAEAGFSQEENAPWLLKIILACFPTALGEKVLDLQYQEKVLFERQECQELIQFLQKQAPLLSQLSLEQGSMFFLRFGPRKHEKLKQSLENVQSGIGYAMNNLKTLQKVVLQDKVVEKYPVSLERYAILPGTADFQRIDPEFPNCPIEISLGFPTSLEQALALKDAPSLYQFFPMRNERHSMAFFVHSSSFAKITDRTRLDDQGEANVETFKYITQALRQGLQRYRQQDFERYLLLFRNLLLTDASKEYDAKLINTHLYEPLFQLLQNGIPTTKRSFYVKDLVVLKKTRLPIDPMNWGISKEWFYWTDKEQDQAILEAAAEKLQLKRWGLKELILEGNAELINAWLEGLDEEQYQVFVAELKKIKLDAAFAEKFRQIRCFKCSDNHGLAQFYAIEDLVARTDLFLLNERSASIREEIKALGYAVLALQVDDYAAILEPLVQQLQYLSQDSALFQKISVKLPCAQLSPEGKHRLFGFVSQLSNLPKDALRLLPLFADAQGQVRPLQQLLPLGLEHAAYLHPYTIRQSEWAEGLTAYCAQSGTWEVYAQIILPNWNQLVKHPSLGSEEAVFDFYKQVQALYAHKPGQAKIQGLASIWVDEQKGFALATEVFYQAVSLSKSTQYTALSTALSKTLELHLPHPSILAFLNQDPFKLPDSTTDKDWKRRLGACLTLCATASLSIAEKQALFEWLGHLLPSKDLAQVSLFEQQKGQRIPLAAALSPELEGLPAWLSDFVLKKEEFYPALQAHLCKENDVYPQIICNYWLQLIQLPLVSKQPQAFYEQVVQYARLSKSPKTLLALPCVFINTQVGFVSMDKVFYHPALAEVESGSYEALQSAILSLTELHLPHHSILPALQESWLKAKEGALQKSLKVDLLRLPKEEVAALIQFLDKTKEDFFQILCVEEAEGQRECLLHKKTPKLQACYVDKSQPKLAEQIKKQFGDVYKVLPHKLYFPQLRNKGLILGAQLAEQLTKSKDTPEELLSALLSEGGNNADWQAQVFQKIDKILLIQGQSYGKDSFEHQALQIFRNKDADHQSIRQKIFVQDDQGNQYRLSDIGFDAQVNLSLERLGKFGLDLAVLLPRFIQLQQLQQQILGQLTDYEAPTVLKRRCFEAQECSPKQILQELQRDFAELDNAQQLAFVLIQAKSENNPKLLRQFLVESSTGDWLPLSQFHCFYLRPYPFLDPQAILSEKRYQGLEQLLRLQERRNSWEVEEQRWLLAPSFEKNLFYCAPLRQLGEEEDRMAFQKEVLDFAYQQWEGLEPHQRPSHINVYGQEDAGFLGLQWTKLVAASDYALKEEQLPEWLAEWLGTWQEDWPMSEAIGDDEENVAVQAPPTGKLSFLYALGLHTKQSPLLRLRRYLSQGQGAVVGQKLLNECQTSLEPSLWWLYAQGCRFDNQDERLYWLRKLYLSLPQLHQDLPLPCLVEAKGEVLSYELCLLADRPLYFVDAKQQNLLQERYQLPLQNVLDQLQAEGACLTNLDLKGLELKASKLEEKLDLDSLEAQSQEWGAEHYLRWKEQSGYSIYLYPQALPHRLLLFERSIGLFHKEDAALVGQRIYVNQQVSNLEDSLFQIKASGWNDQILLSLLRYKNEAQSQGQAHPTIQRVVEKVVVEDWVEDHQEVIENPSLDQIEAAKARKAKGELKVAIDLDVLPQDLLEQLLQLAKKKKVIVDKA